jgi:voltage-gated sodium channel
MTSKQALSPWRQTIQAVVMHSKVQLFLIVLILINAVLMGLETSTFVTEHYGAWLEAADEVILSIFVLEIVALLLVHGWRFFKDGWAVFDFIVIAIALVPASGPFAVLRALRVLRVLRLATKVPSLHKVVAGLLAAIPGLGSVGAVMALIFYVSGVLATNLFSKEFPDTFGTLGLSLYTLFQVMTGDGWSDSVARPIMEVFPYAWIFFVAFILISTFVILNLFIAVIVDASNHEAEAAARAERNGLRERLDQLLIEVKDIKKQLKD